MIKIRRIPIDEFLAAHELHAEYADECSIHELGPATPQVELYKKMDASGVLRCFGAFSDDKMIGYANLLIYGLLHYPVVIGTVESIFVAKSHRSTSAWTDLKLAIKEHGLDEGCKHVMCSCPVGGALEQVMEASKDAVHTNSVFLWRLS